MMNIFTKRNRGISMVELLIVVFIVSVLATAIGAFRGNTFSNERVARSRILAVEGARLTIRRFLEETRNTSPSSVGSYPISLAQKQAFTFYADLDNDGLKERFHYYLESGSLKKGILRPTGSPAAYVGGEKVLTMASNISSTTSDIFTYYDTNDATMTDPILIASVRSVRLSLPIIISTGATATSTILFEARATLRNLKDNY